MIKCYIQKNFNKIDHFIVVKNNKYLINIFLYTFNLFIYLIIY